MGLVVCGLLVSAALPIRELLSQRSEIAEAEAANRAASQRVAELERLQARLSDPAYVKAQAREKLHFVLPGETSYLLIPEQGSAATSPTDTVPVAPGRPTVTAGEESPWYTQLWSTVEAADAR